MIVVKKTCSRCSSLRVPREPDASAGRAGRASEAVRSEAHLRGALLRLAARASSWPSRRTRGSARRSVGVSAGGVRRRCTRQRPTEERGSGWRRSWRKAGCAVLEVRPASAPSSSTVNSSGASSSPGSGGTWDTPMASRSAAPTRRLNTAAPSRLRARASRRTT